MPTLFLLIAFLDGTKTAFSVSSEDATSFSKKCTISLVFKNEGFPRMRPEDYGGHLQNLKMKSRLIGE